MNDIVAVGDRVVVESTLVDRVRCHCEVLEVLGDGDGRRYRLRWDDGAETIFFPGADARIDESP